jgi:acetyltransferase-like isoleucine patch superfamily enzyme
MFSFLVNLPQRVFNKTWRVLQLRIARAREQRLNALVDAGGGRFVIASPGLKVELWKGSGARLVLHGDVVIRSDLGGDRPVKIAIASNGTMEVLGEFAIGDGVLIIVGDNARLSIGGRKRESGSGITCDSKIFVSKVVEIGTDFICAWQVFITDSDHHYIKGQPPSLPVRIGDHVWIAFGAAVLKGSQIGDGCIVAAHSVVHRQTFPPHSLIAGIPARVARSQVEWSRDIPREAM